MLVDFPDHANVGDSAIWVGQYKKLRKITGRHAAFVASCGSPVLTVDEWRSLPGQIFLHGGGNFGDLYPQHQNYRLGILNAVKGRRIVQLAQSLHFSDASAVKDTARAIREHGNFCFFARDQVTYDFAWRNFDCEVKLVPDGAFGLGPLARTRPATVKTLQFRREDVEALGGPIPGSVDWPLENPAESARVRWPGKMHNLLRGNISRASRLRAGCNAVAEWRLKRGLDLLSSAEEIVCDRLHVHILSTLLGIPHRFSDNTTGKISAYYKTWTHECSLGKPLAGAQMFDLLQTN
ncbi:polysaccharide pyruvyl transferase family protein [Devosia sp. 919]|uniref:polysaccharide pyruvyl transferase family protein n=1 Tax=Devosia sp. 919 TaxID=2726065 RepID=UPI001555108F